jgi:hypothetical protein
MSHGPGPSVSFQSRPLVSRSAILSGSFELAGRTPFKDYMAEKAVKKAIENGLASLAGLHGQRVERILASASQIYVDRPKLHPGLDPEDLFGVPWPVRFGLKRGSSKCILCVGLGSAFPEFGEASAIERGAFHDFLKLKTLSDCQNFATTWGLLGNWQTGNWSYVPSDSADAKSRLQVAHTLFEHMLIGSGSSALERGIHGSVFGEPLEAWLWHASRLRTWRKLLGSSSLPRQLKILNHPVETLRIPQPGVSPAEGLMLPGWFVPHLSPELFRSANSADIEAIDAANPWDYAVHQEGGFMRFAHERFRAMREISKESLDARFENEVAHLIRGLLAETLSGKVSFQPLSVDGFASVEPISLLAWLYVEFANQHAGILGGTVRSAPCQNPGCQKLAIWHGIGRPRKHCSDSCRTAANTKRRISESSSI